MSRTRTEIVVALVVAAVGGGFLHQATLIEFTEEALVGPRLVPVMVAGAIIALSGIMILATFIMARRNDGEDAASVIGKGEPEARALTGGAIGRMTAIIIAGFLYIFLFSASGYLISTAVALTALMVIFRNRPPLKVALVALCGTSAYYLLFIKLMGIHDPGGWLIDLHDLGLG